MNTSKIKAVFKKNNLCEREISKITKRNQSGVNRYLNGVHDTKVKFLADLFNSKKISIQDVINILEAYK